MKLLQNSGVPIYQQIAAAFREEILTKKRKSGEYLPSIRGLAKELKISVITTMKAYEMLEEEGFVTAVQGKGFVVNTQDSSLLQEQYKRKIEENITMAIKSAKVLGLNKQELTDMFELLWKMQ